MGWQSKEDAKRYRDRMKINGKAYVYRYIDKADGITKYVGITYARDLRVRIEQHKHDSWCKYKDWKVQYFVCENRSEAEAFESHLIALYGTGKYYNKMKAGWGVNEYLPDIEDKWIDYEEPVSYHYADEETERAVKLLKQMIKLGYIDIAKQIFDCFDFEDDEDGDQADNIS